MIAALRYEWVRIRTIRSTWWVSGIAVVLAVGVSFLIAMGLSVALSEGSVPPDEMPVLGQVVVSQGSALGEFGPPFLLPYVLVLLGVFAWGHEYRHGMVRATLTALSSRTHAWAAKYVVVGAWVVATMLVALALCAAVGWLWLRDDGIRFATVEVWATIAKSTTYTVLFVWIGMAVTSLLRNQTGALVVMLVWPLVLENILQGAVSIVPALRDSAEVLRFLPFEAGKAMLSALDVNRPMWGDPLTPWAGFLVFAAFTAAFLVLSLLLFRKRDA